MNGYKQASNQVTFLKSLQNVLTVSSWIELLPTSETLNSWKVLKKPVTVGTRISPATWMENVSKISWFTNLPSGNLATLKTHSILSHARRGET